MLENLSSVLTSALSQLYSNSISVLPQPYFHPKSFSLTSNVHQLYCRYNSSPIAALLQPYSSPASTSLQLYFGPTTAQHESYLSRKLHTFLSPTPALHQINCCCNSAIRRHFFSSTSAQIRPDVPQPYYSLSSAVSSPTSALLLQYFS